MQFCLTNVSTCCSEHECFCIRLYIHVNTRVRTITRAPTPTPYCLALTLNNKCQVFKFIHSKLDWFQHVSVDLKSFMTADYIILL